MVFILLIAVPIGCVLGVLGELMVQRSETTDEWLFETAPATESWLVDAHPQAKQAPAVAPLARRRHALHSGRQQAA